MSSNAATFKHNALCINLVNFSNLSLLAPTAMSPTYYINYLPVFLQTRMRGSDGNLTKSNQ